MEIDHIRRIFFASLIANGFSMEHRFGKGALERFTDLNSTTSKPPSDTLLVNRELKISLPQTLASLAELKKDVAQYLVAEKLDGVRAYWDGKQLYFRSGRIIHAPVWFTENLPEFAIDGELWIGRGQFGAISAITRRQQPIDREWKTVKYCLFELPNAEGGFEERYQRLKALPQLQSIPWLEVVEQQRFSTTHSLKAYFNALIANHAEGLVLHEIDAVFAAGRIDKMLKLKPYFDAEAVVTKHITGTGKYQGMMGALLVEDATGRRFKLGSGFNDAMRKRPPGIGTWVSYRYRDQTPNGLPRFASFLRMYEPD